MRTAFLFAVISTGLALGQPSQPEWGIHDPGVITTRQTITPAGTITTFRGRVHGVKFGRSADHLEVVTPSSLFSLDIPGNKVERELTLPGRPGMQAIARPEAAGGTLLVTVDSKRGVELIESGAGGLTTLATGLGKAHAGSLAVGTLDGRRIAAICLARDNALALVDLDTRELIARIETGMAPFGVAIEAGGGVAWVSNWGGRRPKAGEEADPMGLAADADRVLVDNRGIASSGTVTRIDLKTRRATGEIAVGLHPTALLLDEKRHRLYVANTNGDSISVIDTAAKRVLATTPIVPKKGAGFGVAPTALAGSPDGSTLYIACGGLNAVAVADPGTLKIRGFIPTAWYPSTLAVSGDGKRLAIGSLLGIGSGYVSERTRRQVHSIRGTLQVVTVPGAAELASFTTAVMANSRLSELPASPNVRRSAKPQPVPERAGEPSPIEYVVYIIKENRTYDAIFGDMPRGNNDPELIQFPRKVTPNHHLLAGQFVQYDNLYATGGNSADGHQWATQANEVAWCMWPGYVGRSYPFDGSDPLAASASGFLWDLAAARNRKVAIFGEYAGRESKASQVDRHKLLERWKNQDDFSKDWTTRAPMRSVNRFLVANYPGYTTGVPDVVRAQLFRQKLEEWRKAGAMPNLVLVQLPSDHTNGTSPGASTPSAMVADNDYAMGQMVEALSHSPFWKKMAIFVVEDDAQAGFDHVDGHRTVALTISPYAKRGMLDSTFYSQTSIVKTIELILGLPTMSMFDLIASDMRASFTATPDFTPYTALPPEQSLFEKNPAAAALRGPARKAALESAKMHWEIPDAVPSRRLNEIVWHATRGWDVRVPKVRSTLFAPGDAVQGDDEDE